MQPTVTDLLMLCKHDTAYPTDTVISCMQHCWQFLFRRKKKKKKKRGKLWRCTSLNTTQLCKKEASRPQIILTHQKVEYNRKSRQRGQHLHTETDGGKKKKKKKIKTEY